MINLTDFPVQVLFPGANIFHHSLLLPHVVLEAHGMQPDSLQAPEWRAGVVFVDMVQILVWLFVYKCIENIIETRNFDFPPHWKII